MFKVMCSDLEIEEPYSLTLVLITVPNRYYDSLSQLVLRSCLYGVSYTVLACLTAVLPFSCVDNGLSLVDIDIDNLEVLDAVVQLIGLDSLLIDG